MLGFKRQIIEMLQRRGFIISKTEDNKSKFTVQMSKTVITLNFGKDGTALLQYFTKTKVNIKDCFDKGNSGTEILDIIVNFFGKILKIQKLESKIDKKQTEIIKLKEEILSFYRGGDNE